MEGDKKKFIVFVNGCKLREIGKFFRSTKTM